MFVTGCISMFNSLHTICLCLHVQYLHIKWIKSYFWFDSMYFNRVTWHTLTVHTNDITLKWSLCTYCIMWFLSAAWFLYYFVITENLEPQYALMRFSTACVLWTPLMCASLFKKIGREKNCVVTLIIDNMVWKSWQLFSICMCNGYVVSFISQTVIDMDFTMTKG